MSIYPQGKDVDYFSNHVFPVQDDAGNFTDPAYDGFHRDRFQRDRDGDNLGILGRFW